MRCAGIGTKAGARCDPGDGGLRRSRAARVCACGGAPPLAAAALAGSVMACGRPTPLACSARGVSAPRRRATA